MRKNETMAEYIEREAALEALEAATSWTDMGGRLEKLPSADVAPVVRCADCKWFQCNMRQDGYLPDGVSECECRHWCGPCDPTDYCSHGAKRDMEG